MHDSLPDVQSRRNSRGLTADASK